MDLVVKGTSKAVSPTNQETYESSNFDKLMKDCNINVERAQAYRDRYTTNYNEIPGDDITGKLIREAIGFSSPYLDNTLEFQDLKNHLILFYEEQQKRNRNPNYNIPGYAVLNVLMLSLRQLIIELLKEVGSTQQIQYLDRVVNWFYNK